VLVFGVIAHPVDCLSAALEALFPAVRGAAPPASNALYPFVFLGHFISTELVQVIDEMSNMRSPHQRCFS
jgi:hypothetical protein